MEWIVAGMEWNACCRNGMEWNGLLQKLLFVAGMKWITADMLCQKEQDPRCNFQVSVSYFELGE